ncbi:TRAP-type C4-dicarboxylate transport system, small permease component [Thermanaeromonas toyohensis ToBE]|uniref:TRAP-type C4-dicarboxylate transport system, small permease component n=1 Tax=Thermanaeromonas toyohensis ToBE TaxID=698762 RepID=A0A1W1VYM6_9FIRM|nr:TRAP transporter small permease [Thermanaeromonas toyohensis]SMB98467.1 TRAP-type C4-dicarboxylate transport system, small permease component [Thermanaeromonas toyohensis ToBE]
MGILVSLNRLFLKLAEWGVIIGMGILVVVIPYEVFGRYVLGDMPPWSAELTTFTLVWISLLGSAIGLKKGYQVGITFVLERLPLRISRGVRFVGLIFMLLFLGIMVYYGADQALYNVHQTSPALGIPMTVPYAAIPVGAFMMWAVTLEELLQFFYAGVETTNRM